MNPDTSEAQVVQTETGKEVRMSYRRGCHDYVIGVATAFFMSTTVLGFILLWKNHVPENLYHTSVLLFVVFAFAGFAILGIGYTRPVWFYELMEDES